MPFGWEPVVLQNKYSLIFKKEPKQRAAIPAAAEEGDGELNMMALGGSLYQGKRDPWHSI